MTVFLHISTECGADCVFALMVLDLGVWSAVLLTLQAVNVLNLLPTS